MLYMASLAEILLRQWQQIRQLTYNYLDVLDPSHLTQTLPFPESQSLGYQFWCMVGAHESYLKKLEHGSWQGFASSLSLYPAESWTPALIHKHMARADTKMVDLLTNMNLEVPLSSGQPGYEVVMQMIKHEMLHHGQLINFLYYLRLPIPALWHEEWALAYGE
jgi:hypothetical protein